MTAEEIRKSINDFLNKSVTLNMGMEYEHVIGFRLSPSQLLCIIKDTGEVKWEDDLPDELVPKGEGKIYLLN